MISAALAAPANVGALMVSKAATARFRGEIDIRCSPLGLGVHRRASRDRLAICNRHQGI
jgi:hypothetical protein